MVLPQFLSDFFDENLEKVMYATFYDGNIYQYCDESVGTDFGNAITAQWVGRAEDFSMPGYRKFFNEIWLNIPQVLGESVTLQCFNDEDTSPTYSRSILLNADGAWKAFKFPTNGIPATQLRLGISYNGEQAITLDGIHAKVGLLTRRPNQPR